MKEATQRPSLGRIVHYTPDPYVDQALAQAPRPPQSGQELAAIVTGVFPGNGCDLVTLTVFHPTLAPVVLPRGTIEGEPGKPGTWHWPERVVRHEQGDGGYVLVKEQG